MKKIFTLLISLSCICQAFGYDFEVNGIYYNITSSTDMTVEVTGEGHSYTGDITIPESVTYSDNNYIVTRIGEYAFSSCRHLTSVTLPNSVISIGGRAFCYCWELTSITLSNSLINIGESAFSNCSSLSSITIPSSVTGIGSAAFERCTSLPVIDNIRYADTYLVEVVDKTQSSICIKEGTRFIGDYAFYGCTRLISLFIPESVTSIGEWAFSGCSKLVSITIHSSINSIGNLAFSSCASLPVIDNIRYAGTYLVEVVDKTRSTYTIKEGTRFIGSYAFSGCNRLASITLPESVTSINEYAFSGCKGLTSVAIPTSVTSIGDYAFSYCTSLASITIPEGVTSIERSAFEDCSSLTSITLPESVTSIGQEAFCGCSSLTSITLPESVTSIEYSAFCGCSSLTSIVVPNSVTSIENRAFSDCTGLTDFYVSWDTPLTFEIFASFIFIYSPISNATLHVPAGTKALYEAADVWKDFGTIVEDAASGLDILASAPECNASVYTLDGTRTSMRKCLLLKNGKKLLIK